MTTDDEAAIANRTLWEREVQKGCGYTIPWLDLDIVSLRRFAGGELAALPEPMSCIFPVSCLSDVEGRDVLCLAAGGGQQSAVFGLLGAHVTVVDFAEGQLAGDRKAAAHYGYALRTVCADMRDLSELDDESFDLVFQANSMAYVPDVRVVYAEVARVLKASGVYRVDCSNPATAFMKWNGETYCVSAPYSEKVNKRDDGGMEFRHYMEDIFNGLIDSGFSIRSVHEEPYFRQSHGGAVAGSWHHERAYVAGGFAIIAKKEKKTLQQSSVGDAADRAPARRPLENRGQ